MKRAALETELSEPRDGISRESEPVQPAKRSISIQLGGKEYRLRSDADPEWLQRVASYVDKSMQQIRDRTDTVDSLDIALLAALNLAREVLQLRGAAKDAPESDQDSERIRNLIELVETELRSVDSQISS